MRLFRLPLVVLSLLVLLSGLVFTAFAQGIYTGGTTGYDISYPQGNGPYPAAPFAFGVVGVISGRAYNDNSYLTSQFTWATQGTTTPSLYMNLNAPVGSTVKGNTTTPRACSKGDKVCQAYNYGYNAASHSYAYALSKGASSSMWWLDIETGNSWSSTKSVNAATIQGAIDYLAAQGATTGIYSTASMWNTIAGSAFTTPVPNWVAGGTTTNYSSLCSQPFTQGGTVYLVQYPLNGFDGDYACQ